jgi:glyoxylase-like metal-dependent hydrolase (beta-lactamase superfamily II)
MARVMGYAAAGVVLLAGMGAILLYGQITSFDAVSVGDDVSAIHGRGGNVAILATERGAVIVDTMGFLIQARQIRELAETLGRGPTQVIVNTHYHWDHTHGNPAFAAGARIVSTRATLDALRAWDAEYWDGEAGARLPNETFEDQHEMKIGGKTIRSYHLGRGHTAGDLVVLFVEDRVLVAGDLFFNGVYPNIDLESGGSVREWVTSLDRALALDFDRVIPGHGPVSDRAGLEGFRDFLRELWRVGVEAAAEGRSLDDTLDTAKLDDRGFAVFAIPFMMRRDRDFVIRRAWEEATGAVQTRELPSSEEEE